MKSKYVALSYCWGHQEGRLTAKESTLPTLRTGVRIAQLPTTLRDAVIVTMRLGSRLIWIDSLCIIQDDGQDWKREAGKMSTVYAQSLVTIIASSAKSCSDGFLETRREKSIPVGQVRIQNKATEIRARVLYDWGHHRGGPQSHETSRQRWMDPVDTRGWTLQERLLSGRYINFTSGEVQWGCISEKACECGQTLYGQLYDPLEREKWFTIIHEYSTRKLTVATDKLVALAGMAKYMSASLSWEWYAAGLWISSQCTALAARCLLWHRAMYSPITIVPADYIAPSFSWASISGEVTHFLSSEFSNCTYPSKIVDVDLSSQTGDMFGSVDAGFIRINGPLIRARLSWTKSEYHPELQAQIKVEGVHRSYMAGCKIDGVLELALSPEGQNRVRRKTLTSNTPEADFEGADVVLLPIVVHGNPSEVRFPQLS
jgi:hypothetical protein